MLAGARSLADVIERAASLLVGDGVLLVEELCWERLDPETARWFFGFQDAVARERRFRVSKRKFADRLDDWQAEHAGLRTGDEIVQALGESFELVSVEHGAHLGRMLDWDGATTYEQMAIDAGVIRPMGLRVTGALPGG
jgi:hypothetical protein